MTIKKVAMASILGLSVLSLSACDEEDNKQYDSEVQTKVGTEDFSDSLVRDEKTGCIYIEITNRQYQDATVPYYDKDGKVAGCGKTEDSAKGDEQ